MKILFAMASPEYLRYYDSTIRLLADRGHEIVVAVNAMNVRKPVRLEDLGGGGRITLAGLVPPRDDMWTGLARGVRGTMDFMRYTHPGLGQAAALRDRMKRNVLPRALGWLDAIPVMSAGASARCMRALQTVERAIPASGRLGAFLDAHRPDMVLVSPLIDEASDQVDLIRAARARGVRTGACIASWDNLTNKGDLRVPTDRVFVWNEAQKAEAITFHRVPAERVVVTGAQLFDRWFGREPARPRDAFCARVGLPGGRPYVLFVGSSVFISRAETEIPFVRRWVAALRASGDAAVRDLAVLIRPHPYNGAAWADVDLSEFGDVAVWPKGRHNPIDEANRADFFDSMYHSEAVVGVNTSAMIESAIVGRPVLSIQAQEFSGTQQGTLHFHHLLPENGGFLRVAPDLATHVEQLAGIVRAPGDARAELRRFVASFVRPHGLDRACTPILVDALERFGASAPPAPAGDGAVARVLRIALLPLAGAVRAWPDPARRKREARAAREGEARAETARKMTA